MILKKLSILKIALAKVITISSLTTIAVDKNVKETKMTSSRFFEILEKIKEQGPQNELSLNKLKSDLGLEPFFSSLYFDEPPKSGEPQFPLGGVVFNLKPQLKIRMDDLVKNYGKGEEVSSEKLAYAFKNALGAGSMSFYFDPKTKEVINVGIHWFYRK